MKTLLAIITALFLFSTPTSNASPDQSLAASGWCCIWVPPIDMRTWEAIDQWIDACYPQYQVWRTGDSDGYYWYLRLYPITDAK